jgi:hypothetical protein
MNHEINYQLIDFRGVTITPFQQGWCCLEGPIVHWPMPQSLHTIVHNTSGTIESNLGWPTLLMMFVL